MGFNDNTDNCQQHELNTYYKVGKKVNYANNLCLSLAGISSESSSVGAEGVGES